MKQNLLKLFLEDESGVTVIEIGCFNRTCHYFQKSAQFFDSITLRQNNKTKQFYLTGGFICEEMQRKYDDYDVPGFFYPALSSPLGYSACPNSGRTDSGNACSRYRYLFYFRPI